MINFSISLYICKKRLNIILRHLKVIIFRHIIIILFNLGKAHVMASLSFLHILLLAYISTCFKTYETQMLKRERQHNYIGVFITLRKRAVMFSLLFRMHCNKVFDEP